MRHPKVAQLTQSFDTQTVDDVSKVVTRELESLELVKRIKPGDSVAITAGSRGIVNIITILREITNKLIELNAEPFIFTSMGSHGGATAEGQQQVLEDLGITEESIGCPVRSSMEVVYLGEAEDGYPIYIDKFASEADHIVVVNRIKAHTKFSGPVESGLMKMMAIGMGKHKGAEYYHKAAVQLTFQKIVENVGREILNRSPVLFGLGIVENGHHQTAAIRALTPENIFDGERALLLLSKRLMGRLPFRDIDVLIIDRIGKNISGTGMDTNVTGRNIDILEGFESDTRVKRIFVRDLTEETAGNALGAGFADFVTTRLVEKMDRKKTYVNCLTAISPEKGAIPMYFDSDGEALQACYNTIGDIALEKVRLVHIKDTLSLTNIVVSRAFEKEIEQIPSLKVETDWSAITLDDNGNMISPFSF